MRILFSLWVVIMLIGSIYLIHTSPKQDDQNTNTPQSVINHIPKKDHPDLFEEYLEMISAPASDYSPAYTYNYKMIEFDKALKKLPKNRSQNDLDWIERGPGNVGGRTRSILIDPNDSTYRTWFLGSVGGGVWKTDDGGQTFRHLTEGLPNLATVALAWSPQNTDVIYVGTGEGIRSRPAIIGSGIWKSNDNGESWSMLESTLLDPRFSSITRMIVDPNDEDVILVSTVDLVSDLTRSYIMKSVDGGESWMVAYESSGAIQQIISPSQELNPIFASINSRGVIRSDDLGITWDTIFTPREGVMRMEIGIYDRDPNTIYVAGEATDISYLFRSNDGGSTWSELRGIDDVNEFGNWMANQGWYDNAIDVHPLNPDVVFVGGAGPVLEITTTDSMSTSVEITETSRRGIGMVLTPIPNTAPLGVVDANEIAVLFDQSTGVEDGQKIDIEFVFDTVLSAQAHRSVFNADALIEYQNMEGVPFAAFDDVGNQLATAYLDVNRNGRWDLIQTEEYESNANLADFPEPIIVYLLDYSGDVPNMNLQDNIWNQGLLLLYVSSVTGVAPANPVTFTIDLEPVAIMGGALQPITDGYFEYFSRFPEVGTKGVHVDHHFLEILTVDDTSSQFYIFNGNDGGIAFSEDGGESFFQTGTTFNANERALIGYNTSQFYGVDKKTVGISISGELRTMDPGYHLLMLEIRLPGKIYLVAMDLKRFGIIGIPICC